MESDNVKLFVYSDMQINRDKEINKSINREFVCGVVSIGSTPKQYSKIIDESMLSGMVQMYPDTKIIHKGKLSETSYTEISTKYLS